MDPRLSKEDLLTKKENGFTVLDHLCAQKRLRDIFDTARWSGCEKDALETYDHVRQHFQNDNVIAALSVAGSVTAEKQRPKIRRRPKA